jgi:hypothetical protein
MRVVFLTLDDARYLVRDGFYAHLGLEIVCRDLRSEQSESARVEQ